MPRATHIKNLPFKAHLLRLYVERAGFVEVSEARSDWAPDPENPLPKFNPPRRAPHGITILGRLFDDGLVGQVGVALERAFRVSEARPTGFDGIHNRS